MKLKPTTRQFLLSAGFVALVFVAAIALFMRRFLGAAGVDGDTGLQVLLIDGSFFAFVLVLGIGVAWVRLVLDRKARRKRKPPLSLG